MKKDYIILTCLLSFCSISYELLFANTLAILAGDIVLWHSLTIGIYVAGLGLGTFRSTNVVFPQRKLISIELTLCLIGAISVASIYFLSAIYETAIAVAKAGYIADFATFVTLKTQLRVLYFILCESLVFAVGYLSGFELPLIMNMAASDNLKSKSSNILIASNYFGTLIGTLVFAYILIPQFDALYSSLIVSLTNFLACLWLCKKSTLPITKQVKTSIVVFSFFLIFCFSYTAKFEQNFLRVYYRAGTTYLNDTKKDWATWWDSAMEKGDVVRIKTLYQYIDYFHVGWKGRDEFILMINTNFQFSSINEKVYHEAFVHIPMMITQMKPENVLVLGAGDGLLLRELRKYKDIKSITHIELDEKMVDLAKNHPFISKLNEGSLSDPTIKRIIGDAFQFLRKTNEKFDAVFIDFPYPQDYNVSKLFSVEFYTFVKRALSKNGFAVIDVPLRNKEGKGPSTNRHMIEVESAFSDRDFERNSIVMSTVSKAGFSIRVPYLVGKETFLIMTNLDSDLRYDLFGNTSSMYPSLDNEALSLINRQYFPHDIDDSYINSVFHPQLVD